MSARPELGFRLLRGLCPLSLHGASQSLSIADFLIRFLSEEQDLVVDPFSGRQMGLAAELLNLA
ncbi:hypothetical protein [Pseudomonas fluorescens]|uniref:hypothetical protein n=1 Tax=Pseudomonas fluorescens TaxID=294 RepID=UPI00123FB13A|nr:hypothetical protein [Pseudomonas fluorescens]